MKKIYAVEYYNDGEIIGYPTKEKAMQAIFKDYCNRFKDIYSDDRIKDWIEVYGVEGGITRLLKEIKADVDCLSENLPWIPDEAGVREISIIEEEDENA